MSPGKSTLLMSITALILGCGEMNEHEAQEPQPSAEQVQSDVWMLIAGEYHSLGGEYLVPFQARVEKHAKLYNQTIYDTLLGPRFLGGYTLNGYHIPSALKHLSRWDPEGSLANAKAYRKLLNHSLMIYDMISDKAKLSAVLESQDANDISTLNRLLDSRKQTDSLISFLENKAGSKPK